MRSIVVLRRSRRRGASRIVAALIAVLLVLSACATSGAEAEHDGYTIAFLRAVSGAPSTEPTFLVELGTLGFVPDRNLRILAADPGEAYPEPDAARAAVERWMEEDVDIIVALSSSGALAASEAAPDVTTLFLSNDPTATGLVEHEDAPEGRLTGVTFRVPADRTLDLARRAVTGLESIGLAYPVEDPAAIANRDALTAAAEALGIDLLTAEFTDDTDVADAVEELADGGAGALVLSTSPTATRILPTMEAAAADVELPLIANVSLASSALISLYPDNDELGRQLARQAARLLSGSTPSAVPVEDPRRFILTVNADRASELGIELPVDLLREADEVTS
jgi:putative tryptophan/tyrosine transport system substrate-binding protein